MACTSNSTANARRPEDDMNDRPPISCHVHDYIEIACLYRFEVALYLRNGDTLRGRAMNTVTRADKRECLLLQQASTSIEVELSEIAWMQALTRNPHFTRVEFLDR